MLEPCNFQQRNWISLILILFIYCEYIQKIQIFVIINLSLSTCAMSLQSVVNHGPLQLPEFCFHFVTSLFYCGTYSLDHRHKLAKQVTSSVSLAFDLPRWVLNSQRYISCRFVFNYYQFIFRTTYSFLNFLFSHMLCP